MRSTPRSATEPPFEHLLQGLCGLPADAVRVAAFLAVTQRALRTFGVLRQEDMMPVLASLDAATDAWAVALGCAPGAVATATKKIERYWAEEGSPESAATRLDVQCT